MATNMSRTLEMLRQQGHFPWIVERFVKGWGRSDLFKIIDVIFLTRKGVVGIQVCGTDFQEHIRKITKEEKDYTKHWLKTKGNELILIGWRKLKLKRGGKAFRYHPRIVIFELKNNTIGFKEVDYKWLRKRNEKGK